MEETMRGPEPIARVDAGFKRCFLQVAGIRVATQGDFCQSPSVRQRFREERWTGAMLRCVADGINEAAAAAGGKDGSSAS